MSDAQSVLTSTGCLGVYAASAVLAAVLVGRPYVETSLAVSEAIEVLGDVYPPLPPLGYPEAGIGAGEGIAQALAAFNPSGGGGAHRG